MEIYEKSGDNEENVNEDINITTFKPEIKGQNMKNNTKFINWKRKMEVNYGNTDKIFYCSEEGIYFLASKKQEDYSLNYLVKCSECNKSYCFFCSKYFSQLNEFEYCCFKRFLLYKLFGKYSEFIYETDYKYAFIMLFFPSIIYLFIIAALSASLFYKRKMKNDKYDYEMHLKKKDNKIFIIVLVLNSLLGILLSIAHISLSILIVLLIIIISIPLQFIPIKIIFGLLISIVV